MSSGSGIAISDAVVNAYKDIKENHKYQFIIFKVNDTNTEIVVDQCGEKGKSWDDFVEAFPEKDNRYAIFDCKFETNDGGQREKLVLVIWNPEGGKIKQKMVYASSKDALKKKISGGIAQEFQMDSKGEIKFEEIVEVLKSKTK